MAQVQAKPEVAVVPEPDLGSTVRRFQIPDVDRHAAWLLPRLQQVYGLTAREALGWLRGIIYSNEFLALYSEHGIAIAQMTRPTLAAQSIIQERFVWVADKDDKRQQAEASLFYDEMAQWAKRAGVAIVIVQEDSDVPHDMIKERMGRLFTRTQTFARIGEPK